MATLTEAVFEWLVDRMTTALAVPCVQGFPSWGQPTLTPPCTALEIAAWQPGTHPRIGQGQTRQGTQYRLWFFARHELELAAMLDRFGQWTVEEASANVAGVSIRFQVEPGLRHEPQTDVLEERHALWVAITASWSVA